MIPVPRVVLTTLNTGMHIATRITEPASQRAVEERTPALSIVLESCDPFPLLCRNSSVLGRLGATLFPIGHLSFGFHQQGLLPFSSCFVLLCTRGRLWWSCFIIREGSLDAPNGSVWRLLTSLLEFVQLRARTSIVPQLFVIGA